MGDIPDFIPKTPGDESVIDLSHTLTAPASDSIQQAMANCNFKSHVLILPTTYKCPDAHQLALDLSKQWHTDTGRTLVMVVDLQGHKVRMIGSPELNESGITSSYITNTLVPRQFIPYMRAGDLGSAVRLTLLEVDRHSRAVSEATPLQTSTSVPTQPPAVQQPPVEVPLLPVLGVIIAVCGGFFAIKFSNLKRKNTEAFADLQMQIDDLHVTADKIEQAADYVNPKENLTLVERISDFFAQLGTLERAYQQTESLVKGGLTIDKATKAIAKCKEYGRILQPRADKLLRDINEKTGAVTSYEPKAAIEDSSTKSAKYRTPSWLALPAHRDVFESDALGSVTRYVDAKKANTIFLNSNNFNSSPIASSHDNSSGSSNRGRSWFSGSGSSSRSSSSDGGGSWFGSSSSSSSSSGDGGGSWSDSSSSSSSDSSSSSESSSSSSSDGGGSW